MIELIIKDQTIKQNRRPIMAKDQTSAETQTVQAEVPAELLRYLKVKPEVFKAAVTERGLTNKEVAQAIGRTLSRVSELTHSKGSSQAIYDQFILRIDEFVAAKAEAPAEEPQATEA